MEQNDSVRLHIISKSRYSHHVSHRASRTLELDDDLADGDRQENMCVPSIQLIDLMFPILYISVLKDSRGNLTSEDAARVAPGEWANDALMMWYIR